MNNNLLPIFKPIEYSNAVAVGAMIGAGKTTLIKGLSEHFKGYGVYELPEDNKDSTATPIMKSMLEQVYKGNKVMTSVFQLWFMLYRHELYKQAVNNKSKLVFFDRTIFEDRKFAHLNMESDPIVFSYYDFMWTRTINELIYTVGLPRIYIILDMSWQTFKERIFKRNRKEEIENWDKNEEYFKRLNAGYTDYLVNICKTYGIDYHVIKTDNKNQEQVLQEAISIVKKII